MPSFVYLGVDHHHVDIAQALSANLTEQNHLSRLVTTTYRSTWNISYLPGPLPLSTTTILHESFSDATAYPFWLLILIAVFGSTTSVLTVLGNILVMLAFFLDRQIRQPTNYFILSLSVSDFLIGLLSMPLLTIYIYAKRWPLNERICDIWLSLDYTVCLTSIYTVLFITIDRFCSVKMPAKYRKWRTKKKINIMIATTWAVPFLIFFTSTMLYPRLKGIHNLQDGVCDVQWNKNPIFNLCLTIGYFWTTLLFMIILYIFIYDVASNLEKKSRENARKMSSLVGMAGNAMTQIGVGIGVNKSSIKLPLDKQNLAKKILQNSENLHRINLHKQISNNSSERRATNDGADDENSNSYESHSDADLNNKNEKKFPKVFLNNNRRGMSVNWGSNSTTAINLTAIKPRTNLNQKSMKTFAQSLYRNPIRIGGLTTTTNSAQPSITLSPIPSEPELTSCRVYPPPQPRPESLAIMSEEVFHEKLKARQSPLLLTNEQIQSTEINTKKRLSICTNDNQSPMKENIVSESILPEEIIDVSIQEHLPNPDESSDESWKLLNSNNSLDIPYIDETDFEDLGYILHRRCVPPLDSNQPIYEETIVYKSPIFHKKKLSSRQSLISEQLPVRHEILKTSSNQSSPAIVCISKTRQTDVERALIDFYHCTPITDPDNDNLTTSESDILSNYKELNQETSSLLHLNERFSSAFIDDEYQQTYSCDSNLLKLMVLNKTNLETTSDEQTITNSISLNTYSQDCSIDRIFQQILSPSSWRSSTTSSNNSQDREIPRHLLAAIEKKRNTSSDSDAVTSTTTTTLTASTLFEGSEKRKIYGEIKKSELSPILKKHLSDICIHENDISSFNNRIASKVTFESFVTQNSILSSPKTKDQSVMVQIDIPKPTDTSTEISKPSSSPTPTSSTIPMENKNGRISVPSDGTGTATTNTNSAKSSIRELLHNQKSTNRRKSKSQNRARKALRTITFILGAFVVCWTPWHIYSAVHSLCDSCKHNWIFTNPMFHCFYFLCYLNSPINPFCYALANQQFKKTFTRILKLDLRRL